MLDTWGWKSWLLAALLAVAPTCALAQDAGPPPDKPSSDPDRLDIQRPQPRILIFASLGAGNEYRDRLLSSQAVAAVSASVAWKGFSASAWTSKELSTGRSAYELLVGYSHKLPWVDAHLDLVSCGNQRLLGSCADGARLTLTSNSIAKTTIEASFDQAWSSSRRSWSVSATRDLVKLYGVSSALRAGWTRTDYGQATWLDGFSLRLIAARPIGRQFEIDLAAGPIWTSGRAKPAGARDDVVALISLVWRQ